MQTLAAAKSKSQLTSALLLLLLMFLVACNRNQSSSSSVKQAASSSTETKHIAPTAGSGLPDPCTLLTTAEAKSILGAPVKEPEPNSLGGNKICDYKTTKLYGGIAPYSIHIAITPETRPVWDAGKNLHAESKESRPLAGVGDDAYFLLDDLEILSNQRSITIGVMKDIDKPNHARSVQEAEKAVAEKILPRMKQE